MTRVIKANASQSQQARAAVLDLADFAAEARTVVLDARKDAARIVAEARAKADSAERQARQQGYAEGVARGQTDGYADGREQARAEVVRKFAEEYTELLTLGRNVVNDLTAARAEGLQHACDEIIEIAILLAGRIVSRVAAEDIEAAKANLVKVLERAHLGGQVVVKVNSGQLARLEETFTKLLESLRVSGDVHLVGDDRVSPGGVKLTSPHGQIDATIETQLDNAARILLGHPRAPEAAAAPAAHYQPAINAAERQAATAHASV